MRKIVVAVALLFAVSSQSQQPAEIGSIARPNPVAAPPPLVEKIDVSVVNVDVSVTDRHGQPVSGLTRNDFEIFEDGKPQPITNFYLVENARRATPINAADATAEAGAAGADGSGARCWCSIDNLNTTQARPQRGAGEAGAVHRPAFRRRPLRLVDRHGRQPRPSAAADDLGQARAARVSVEGIQRRGTNRELRASIGRGDSALSHVISDDSRPTDNRASAFMCRSRSSSPRTRTSTRRWG